MKYISKSEKETADIATEFVKNLKANEETATVVGLYGELGSGKTTFMKYVAKELGVKENIVSPTFVLMKRFRIPSTKFQTLIHIDAYRIEKDGEMVNLGWNEIISDSNNLIFIEWPEKIASIMPSHTVIKFEHAKGENRRETERTISIA